MARRMALNIPLDCEYGLWFPTRGMDGVIHFWPAMTCREEGFAQVNFRKHVPGGFVFDPDAVAGKVPPDLLEAMASSPVPGMLRVPLESVIGLLYRVLPGRA